MQIFVTYFAVSTIASTVRCCSDCSECELFLKIRMPCDKEPQKPFRFIIPVAFVYCQHYRNYLLIRVHSHYFTICVLPRVLYFEHLLLREVKFIEKYLISERHSVIYPHNVKRLNLLCSRRRGAVCQSTAWQNRFEDIQFSTSKNESSWRHVVWFQEMTIATDTLTEHTVHDVSNNRHAGVFVVPVLWQSLAWISNPGLVYEFNAAQNSVQPNAFNLLLPPKYFHFFKAWKSGPGAHPASCNGYQVIPGGKAAEAWRRPPTPIQCRG